MTNCPHCRKPLAVSEHVPAFTVGQRVSWSHHVSTQHGAGDVIHIDNFNHRHAAYLAKCRETDPDTFALDGRIGTITARGEVNRNQWEVLLDGDADPRILTADELVQLEGE